MQKTIQQPAPDTSPAEQDGDRSAADDADATGRPVEGATERTQPKTATEQSREVTLTGPGGTDRRLEIPEHATEDEMAAITAAVSTVLATEIEPVDNDGDTTERRIPMVNAWKFAGRCSTTGRRTRTTRANGATDAWKLASRVDF